MSTVSGLVCPNCAPRNVAGSCDYDPSYTTPPAYREMQFVRRYPSVGHNLDRDIDSTEDVLVCPHCGCEEARKGEERPEPPDPPSEA